MNNNENTNENTNGHSKDADKLFQPVITINVPVTIGRQKLLDFLDSAGVEIPLLLLEEVTHINLQIQIDSEGKNDE